jgi:hypothetical protein
MFRWVLRIFGSSELRFRRAPEGRVAWTRPRLDIPRYNGGGRIPPMHWKACHPATVTRFKAEFACPNGHEITLKGHSIDADGTVHPSVVCCTPDCEFHDFVRLVRWDAGPVGRRETWRVVTR